MVHELGTIFSQGLSVCLNMNLIETAKNVLLKLKAPLNHDNLMHHFAALCLRSLVKGK